MGRNPDRAAGRSGSEFRLLNLLRGVPESIFLRSFCSSGARACPLRAGIRGLRGIIVGIPRLIPNAKDGGLSPRFAIADICALPVANTSPDLCQGAI